MNLAKMIRFLSSYFKTLVIATFKQYFLASASEKTWKLKDN